MASETITRNDLTAILNSVLPNPTDMTPQEVDDFVDALESQSYPLLIKCASRNCVWSNSEGSDEFFANTLLSSYNNIYGILATAIGGGVMAVTRSSSDKLRVILYGGAFTGTLTVNFVFFYD